MARERTTRPARSHQPGEAPGQDRADVATERDRVLELQRTAGNRAVNVLMGSRTLARQPTAARRERTEVPLRRREVDRRITETISHAPERFAQWNGTYRWRAKWNLVLDMRAETGSVIVQVRLHSRASDDVKRAWESAIMSKWHEKFALAVKRPTPIEVSPGVHDRFEELYPIRIRIDWIDDPGFAHYVVRANAPGADEGGRAGQGGTTSMTGWGTADTVDVAHEFGHMLGCPEEYFTTDGVDYTEGGTRQGFRDPEGGVMNNPAGPALARNFALIQREAASLRGVPLDRTEVIPWL